MEGTFLVEERTAPTGRESSTASEWVDICALDDIVPGTGVAALIFGQQIAVFRPFESDEIYALSNYDPFGRAYVMARGIVGDRAGRLKVASPLFKQSFDLTTGVCLDDSRVALTVFRARVCDGRVELEVPTLSRGSE